MNDATWTFMMIAFVLIIIANLIMFYQKGVFGENYTYNMTEDEREELWLSEICMNTSIKITNCEIIYGGIDTDYGEAIESAK